MRHAVIDLQAERWRRDHVAAHQTEIRVMWSAHNRAVAAAERQADLCERLANILEALVRLQNAAISREPTGER